MRIVCYRDLIVWQKAMALVVETYGLCGSLPTEERYGLVSQTRRAAISVVANIAEGHARTARRDFASFLGIARGSLAEVETYFDVAEALGYLEPRILERPRALADEVGRLLSTLQRRVAARYRGEERGLAPSPSPLAPSP